MQVYLLIKWLHILAVISWMAGILYLYRLFIYHAEWGTKFVENHNMLTIMERRLLYGITHPAMAVAWIAGISMIMQNPMLMKQGWFHGKLGCVFLLTIVTVAAGRLHKKFKNKEPIRFSSKQLRFLNEVPTLLMVIIVGLVVLKPM